MTRVPAGWSSDCVPFTKEIPSPDIDSSSRDLEVNRGGGRLLDLTCGARYRIRPPPRRTMPDMNIIQAVNDCLRLEMRRDPRVVVLGEDVGRFGGVFRATTGLQEEFGADRCFDTPLAEAGIIGS